MRLSRKASEMVSKAFAQLERDVRAKAAERAHFQGREFADESDVKWAYREMMLAVANDIMRPPQLTELDL